MIPEKSTLRGKLLRWAAVIFLLLLLLIASRFYLVHNQGNILTEIEESLSNQRELEQARYIHSEWMHDIERSFITGTIPEIKAEEDCDFYQWLNHYEPHPEERVIIANMTAHHNYVHETAEEVTSLLLDGEEEEASELYNETLSYSRALNSDIDDLEASISARLAQLESDYAFNRMILFAITFGVLFLLALTFIVFLRFLDSRVFSPLDQLSSSMLAVKKGNYKPELDIEEEGEIKELADSFRSMLNPLRLQQLSLDTLQTMVNERDEDKLLNDILGKIKQLKEVDFGAFYEYNEWEEKFVLTAVQGELPHNISSAYKLNQGLVGRCVFEEEKVTIKKLEEPLKQNKAENSYELNYILCGPVYYGKRLLGTTVLGLHSPFHPAATSELEQTCALLGISLYNLRQYHSIQALVDKQERQNIELEQQKKFAEAVLKSSDEGIMAIDCQGRIQTWSQGATAITGYLQEEALNLNFQKLFVDDLISFADQKEETAIILPEEDELTVKETKLQRKSGEVIPCRISISKIEDSKGDPQGAVLVFQDLSEEREQRRKLERALRIKNEFLSTMSHELRTPLNAIMGFAEILQRQTAEKLSEREQKQLKNIAQSGQQLLKMIEDMLDLIRYDQDDLKWHQELFLPERELENIFLPLKKKARDKDITFNREIEVSKENNLLADSKKIKQIIYNLLENAVKFNQGGGTVELRIKTDETGFLIIEVEDDGIGIPADKQAKIFEPFVQLESSLDRRFEGAGLGLDLVKSYVELAGGDIKITSTPGKGSTFTVTLPGKLELYRQSEVSNTQKEQEQDELEEEKEEQQLQTSSPPQSIERKKALVIEDESTAREIIGDYLKEMGFEVLTAGQGEEGLQLARDNRDDLALITLDLLLPDAEGWEILKRLKAEPATRSIPVIIISSLAKKEKGLVLGASDFITKPVKREILEKSINRIRQWKTAKEGKMEILAIDDEPQAHEVMKALLAELDCHYYQALKGKLGITKAAEIKPDLILLDLMMPEMDGFEVLRRLAERPATKDIPVIIVTAKLLSTKEKEELQQRAYRVASKSELKYSTFKQELYRAGVLREIE